jgi:two-component system alkaline phosphatase synthesis response regulator PhoP
MEAGGSFLPESSNWVIINVMPKKILVIDDEPKIVELCNDYLRAAGFEVITAGDGLQGLALTRSQKPDLVVLDLMLPGMDGLDLCRALLHEGNTPIIMLTARIEETDKLIGLEMGADDYMTKPFSPRELVVRVRTVLRRASGDASSEVIRAGDLTLDRSRYQVNLPDRSVVLTLTEFEILATLMSCLIPCAASLLKVTSAPSTRTFATCAASSSPAITSSPPTVSVTNSRAEP